VSNQDFIDLVRDEFGVYVCPKELRHLQIELFNKTQERRLLPYDGGELVELEYELDKVFFVVGGALLGGFLLPGLGIAAGFTQGALLGAAVGYRLAGVFTGGQDRNSAPDIKSQAVFTFGETGELIFLNSPVPVIYTNADTNTYANSDGVSEGGLYVEAKTIYTRIAPIQGSQTLTKLGVLGGGKIAQVSETTLRIDDQERSGFGLGDVITIVGDGGINQPALGGINHYCQAVSQNSNSFLGVGAGVTAQGVTYAAAATITAQDLVNATFSTGTLTKTTVPQGWDAGGRSQSVTLPARYGDFVEFQAAAGELGLTKAFGISTTNTTTDIYDIDFVFTFNGGNNTYQISLNNTVRFISTANFSVGQIFSVRLYRAFPTNYVQVLDGNTEIWRGTTTITDTVFGDYVIYHNTARLTDLKFRVCDSLAIVGGSFVTADFLAGIGRRFLCSADRQESFKNNVFYTNTTAGDVKVVARDATAGWIEFDRDIWVTETTAQVPLTGQGAKSGSKFYPRYTSTINTTKAVNQLEIVILANLDARDSSGNLLQFGLAFEISLDDGTGYQVLGRLMISAKSATQTYRSLLISNLPKKIYKVKVKPLLPGEISASIRSIGESGNLQSVATTADFGLGAVIWRYDFGIFYSAGDAQTIIDPTAGGKTRTSVDNGAPAKVTHINEIVTAPTPPTYAGYTTALQILTASDRIQSTPQVLWDVRKGRICRNHLSAGTATSTSGSTWVDDVTAHFVDDGVVVGCSVRVLDKALQRVVTAMTQTRLVCATYSGAATTTAGSSTINCPALAGVARVGMPVVGTTVPAGAFIEEKNGDDLTIGDGWGRPLYCTATDSTTITLNSGALVKGGDRYVVFSMAASNYLPDIYVDRLINPTDGLGGLVDQDYFVHYSSICRSRRFCVNNNLFYDGIVENGTFETWATDVAASSLLYPTKIEGQYALIPEQNERVKGIFNAYNLIDYSEPYTEWQSQATNTVLAKFADKRGREQQRKIQTLAAANGDEFEIVQTIDLKGVTNPDQAIDVGCVALKSLREQNRVCKFTTDIANLTCQHGDIIRTQHALVEYNQEKSGIVTAIEEPINARLANSGAIASILKTLPGSGGTTVIYFNQPHGLIDGSVVTISGHSATTLNDTFEVDIYDDVRLSVDVAYVAGTGGSITKQRTIYDQVVELSEPFELDPGLARISIGHRLTPNCEVDLRIYYVGEKLTIIGLEQPVQVGDLFIMGSGTLEDRTWRISSLKPTIAENKAEIVGVVWTPNILTRDGLVIT
jgi:hypothetical protein